MRKTGLFIILLMICSGLYSQIYIASSSEISFFSEATIENIEAVNKASKPILNTSTGDIQIKIPMKGFVFAKPLMQEHFNEDYAESEKFPDAFFRGKINEQIDYTKDGEYKATAAGKITIHGVEKEKTLEGTLIVKGGHIVLQTKFNIHIADYGIKVPSLYVKNIAEDVSVKLNATLDPYKK